MRIRDWYFQGWERRTDDNGKAVFVYTGEHYTFPAGLKNVRSVCAPLALAVIAAYAVLALNPSPGGMWHIAAIPQLLELIPLIYMVMGLVKLLTVKEPLTYRDWYASWRRLGTAAVGSAVLTACMVLAELVYMVMYARGAVGPELPFFLPELGCFALSFALADYIRRHPCEQSAPQTDKE